MIKTVIFDIDGTLYDYHGANKVSMEKVCAYCKEQFGWSMEEAFAKVKEAQKDAISELEVECAAMHNRLIRFQIMLEKNHQPIHPHVMNLYNIYWDTLLDQMVLTEGAKEFFETAKKKSIRLGIGTDMTAHIQYRKLDRLGILGYFDFLVTSEEVGEEKPSKKFFLRCLEKSFCQPEECLMIGDVEGKDIAGARNVGMQAVHILYGQDMKSLLPLLD